MPDGVLRLDEGNENELRKAADRGGCPAGGQHP